MIVEICSTAASLDYDLFVILLATLVFSFYAAAFNEIKCKWRLTNIINQVYASFNYF